MEEKLFTKLNNYDYTEFLPYNKQTLNLQAIIHCYLIFVQIGKKLNKQSIPRLYC
jgi:hypothetical protein